MTKKEQERQKRKSNKKISKMNENEDHNKTKNIHDPKILMKKYEPFLENFNDESSQVKNKEKATNIPKFLINIFVKNRPDFKDKEHNLRLEIFQQSEKYSKTRFDLVQLFGLSQDPLKDCQNALNREAMIRLLNRNYSNILTNQHIRNKKAYLMYCKKIMLRLSEPQIIDRLQV